ncbi:hypothetical protein M427DRAFT_149948 [Gonapodya prolifera JEL478]|uniref:SH3 domain-containing protein n=1 Tax=Gonapodya prolifera (strain JEL478) TaxID=1344416 RepID=A0A138ZYF1_GONPJ|nr:hypothetical protein M427DRAFT_149948 [Gonapodya prolifera JEL478]|eukprot:KXS09295.1 hypothetical protein M427DRAFT_149948 [Gonapodya prolifera JEL478]
MARRYPRFPRAMALFSSIVGLLALCIARSEAANIPRQILGCSTLTCGLFCVPSNYVCCSSELLGYCSPGSQCNCCPSSTPTFCSKDPLVCVARGTVCGAAPPPALTSTVAANTLQTSTVAVASSMMSSSTTAFTTLTTSSSSTTTTSASPNTTTTTASTTDSSSMSGTSADSATPTNSDGGNTIKDQNGPRTNNVALVAGVSAGATVLVVGGIFLLIVRRRKRREEEEWEYKKERSYTPARYDKPAPTPVLKQRPKSRPSGGDPRQTQMALGPIGASQHPPNKRAPLDAGAGRWWGGEARESVAWGGQANAPIPMDEPAAHWFFQRIAGPRPADGSAEYHGPPLKAIASFYPSTQDEIALTQGDLIELREVFRDGWAVGWNLATGAFGAFPVDWLRLSPDDASSLAASSTYAPSIPPPREGSVVLASRASAQVASGLISRRSGLSRGELKENPTSPARHQLPFE